jgi:ubiquitin C-terminal hydrolase
MSSELRCLHCGNRNLKVESFSDLSLPLPDTAPAAVSILDCVAHFTAFETLSEPTVRYASAKYCLTHCVCCLCVCVSV